MIIITSAEESVPYMLHLYVLITCQSCPPPLKGIKLCKYFNEFKYINWQNHNHNIPPTGAISQAVFLQMLAISIPDHHPCGHMDSPGENFLVNNCGMYDSF